MSAILKSEDVKETMNPVYRKRLFIHRVGIALSFLAMTIGLIFLMWILFTLVVKGMGAINWAIFTQTTPAPGSEGGGLMNAIVGSLFMVGAAVFISTPIGILAGIYLAEYGEVSWFAKVTRFRDRHHAVGAIHRDRLVRLCESMSRTSSTFPAGPVAFAISLDRDPGSRAYHRQHARLGANQSCAKRPSLSVRRAGALRPSCACAPSRPASLQVCLLAVARISGETAPLLFTASEQPVLQREHERAHGQPAGRDLSIRDESRMTTGARWLGVAHC
jgi:phosphate transport system permease protein